MNTALNRAARCTAAVLAVVALGAAATACESPSRPSSSKAAAPAQDTSADGKGGSGSGAEAPGGDAKTAVQGSRTDAVNVDNAGAAASTRCHTSELGYSWGGPHGGAPDMETDQQQIASIRLTNNGDRTCTLYGFPGVSLISDTGATWDLARSSVTPSTLTLKPGEDTAMVAIDLLPLPSAMKGPTPFKVSKVLVTPPDETTHVTLDWPYGGAILDQSGATHPGTFIDPVVVG